MEHADTAQLAAVGGALGAVLVLLPFGREARPLLVLGLALLAAVELALAWALGSSVHRAPVREIGFVPIRRTAAAAADPFLDLLVDGEPAFQWHMDTFELPDEAVLLATNDAIANQAFRFGDRTWATPFHFEVDRAEIEAWIAGVGDDALLTEWGRCAEDLRAEAVALGDAHEERGRRIFQRFATLVETATT